MLFGFSILFSQWNIISAPGEQPITKIIKYFLKNNLSGYNSFIIDRLFN